MFKPMFTGDEKNILVGVQHSLYFYTMTLCSFLLVYHGYNLYKVVSGIILSSIYKFLLMKKMFFGKKKLRQTHIFY